MQGSPGAADPIGTDRRISAMILFLLLCIHIKLCCTGLLQYCENIARRNAADRQNLNLLSIGMDQSMNGRCTFQYAVFSTTCQDMIDVE